MSFKPEIQTINDSGWYGNSTAFATEAEAIAAGKDIYSRWTMAKDYRAVESDEPVNYMFDFESNQQMPVKQ